VVIARRRRQPPSRVRDMVHAARRRGLLSRHRPGVRGGELTDRAKTLLRRETSRRQRRRGRR
jgi:hypothetical protein